MINPITVDTLLMTKEEDLKTIAELDLNSLEKLDDNAFEQLCDMLKKCTNLQTLKLTVCVPGSELNAKRLTALFDALSLCKNLQNLNLEGNHLLYLNLEEGRFEILCNGLLQLEKLQFLNINDAHLTKELKLWNTLSQCANLKSLYLNNNRIWGDLKQWTTEDIFWGQDRKYPRDMSTRQYRVGRAKQEFQGFCNLITKCEKLEILDMSSNDLPSVPAELLQEFANALAQCPNLKTLYIGDQGSYPKFFSHDSFEILCRAIEGSTIIEMPDIGAGGFPPEQEVMLKTILEKNRTAIERLENELNQATSSALPAAGPRKIVVDYLKPAYASEMLKKSPDQSSRTLEKKEKEDKSELDLNIERESRAELFKMLKSEQPMNVEHFKTLLKKVDVNHVGPDGKTLLLAAAQNKTIPIAIIHALLDQGADPEESIFQANEDSETDPGAFLTAAEIAAKKGRTDVAQVIQLSIYSRKLETGPEERKTQADSEPPVVRKKVAANNNPIEEILNYIEQIKPNIKNLYESDGLTEDMTKAILIEMTNKIEEIRTKAGHVAVDPGDAKELLDTLNSFVKNITENATTVHPAVATFAAALHDACNGLTNPPKPQGSSKLRKS